MRWSTQRSRTGRTVVVLLGASLDRHACRRFRGDHAKYEVATIDAFMAYRPERTSVKSTDQNSLIFRLVDSLSSVTDPLPKRPLWVGSGTFW